jgi:hypothetical protein
VDDTLDWATVGAATSCEADDFATDGVFLVGKGETDKSGSIAIGVRAGEHIEAVITHK